MILHPFYFECFPNYYPLFSYSRKLKQEQITLPGLASLNTHQFPHKSIKMGPHTWRIWALLGVKSQCQQTSGYIHHHTRKDWMIGQQQVLVLELQNQLMELNILWGSTIQLPLIDPVAEKEDFEIFVLL